MGKYFLVARNIHDDSFEILKINEKWYLGCNGDDVWHKDCSLAAIDRVISAFTDKDQLVDQLFKNKYISTKDVDLFIATKKTKDGKPYIKYYDLIFMSGNKRRFNNFRSICYAKLHDDLSSVKSEVLNIYDELIGLMMSNSEFYYMVQEGYTDIPKSIVELLSGVSRHDQESYRLKFRLPWVFNSYSTIRSFIEAIETYKSQCSKSGDFVHSIYNDKLGRSRDRISPQLLKYLDKNYSEDQLSLFNAFGELKNVSQFSKDDESVSKETPVIESMEKNEVQEIVQDEEFLECAKQEEEKKEKVKLPPIEIPQNLSNDEKKKKIFEVLYRFPSDGLFRKNDKFEINKKQFVLTLSDSEMKRLNTNISAVMYKYIWTYAFYSEKYDEANSNGWNTREYVEEIEWARNGINKKLQSEKRLNKVYNWFMLWDGCIERDKAYINGKLESERGKVFEKK